MKTLGIYFFGKRKRSERTCFQIRSPNAAWRAYDGPVFSGVVPRTLLSAIALAVAMNWSDSMSQSSADFLRQACLRRDTTERAERCTVELIAR